MMMKPTYINLPQRHNLSSNHPTNADIQQLLGNLQTPPIAILIMAPTAARFNLLGSFHAVLSAHVRTEGVYVLVNWSIRVG